jgi:hypothetical protein
MKALSFLLFLGFANGIFAQQIATAKIKNVNQNGLHKMIIPSEIRSFAKENLSDFRILDTAGNEVPYALLNNTNVASEVVHFDYKKLKIISKETIPNTSSTVTIENTIQNLDILVLTITKTKIEKSYSISGSKDLKNWYGLCQNEKLEYEKTNVAIPVPVTSYHYIKIVFNDKKSLPINIEEVGFSKITPQKYTTEKIIPKKINIKQIPTEKKTQIEVDFDHPNRITQLSFSISSPTLYNRNAQIFALRSTISV